MARTPIQTLELDIPRSYAAIIESQPFAPWTKHLRANPWTFDRRPFSHATPVAAGGRLGKIYLGEDLSAAEDLELDENGVLKPRTPRVPRVTPVPTLRKPPAPGDTPQVASYLLTLNTTATITPSFLCVSTPQIPYPFRIVNLRYTNAIAISDSAQWNLGVSTEEYNGEFTSAPPNLMIQTRSQIFGTSSGQWTEERTNHGPILAALPNTPRDILATGVIGASVDEPGQSLILVVKEIQNVVTTTIQFQITIEELITTRARTTREINDVLAPRVAQPRPGGKPSTPRTRPPATERERAAAAAAAKASRGLYRPQPPCKPCDPADIHPGWWCNPADGAFNSPEAIALRAQACGGRSANADLPGLSASISESFNPAEFAASLNAGR